MTNRNWKIWLAAIGLILLVAWPRLTHLNQYVIVDEADRWRWAEAFVYALAEGDLAATRVGDGYPGIVPVWVESLWLLLEAGRRSFAEGQWIGEPGLNLLFHEWDREEFLGHQRFPIVLFNTVLALTIIWAVWRLFGGRVALVSGILIALDPFYLSDSRVNRAEAVITGLMTLSILFLVFYDQQRRRRYIILSGIFGGLSLLTKIQALAMVPAIALIGCLIYFRQGGKQYEVSSKQEKPPYSLLPTPYSLLPLLTFGLIWLAAAVATWFLLWPAMWVIPVETLTFVYQYATRKVGAEGVTLFYMGETFLDEDPGYYFYFLVFFLRLTPLALLGLLGALLHFIFHRFSPLISGITRHSSLVIPRGSAILIIYSLAYALIMSFGSHKQDRYLMPIFLCVDILAAMGLVYLGVLLQSVVRSRQYEGSRKQKKSPYSPALALLGLLLLVQLLTILPHRPYYYSYFNPLLGGGRTAVNLVRIGWGEGMDQVGRYLAAKPNSRELVVSSRFTHNMPAFKGERISLTPGGRWTQADYIVLYIQQVQRHLDPSPGFIDYFMARQPEKVITLGDIDYAWIYPIPFTTPANPQISRLSEQAALLGYRWERAGGEGGPAQIRLFWENLGLAAGRRLAARLVDPAAQTGWTPCEPDPNFKAAAQTPGQLVESLCPLEISALPAGLYTVEFGLTAAGQTVEPFLFPEGWQAARVAGDGTVADVAETERLAAIVAETVPPAAPRLDRVYEGQLRLVAYRLEPARPGPGQPVELTLYWQPVKQLRETIHLVVQLADSRLLPLGRADLILHRRAEETSLDWLPGQVITTRRRFDLTPDLDAPLAGQIEIKLTNDARVPLRPTTLTGEPLDDVAIRFTVAPQAWPTLAGSQPVTAAWPNGPALRGYRLLPGQAQPGEPLAVTLFWEATRPITETYTIFVHLLDEAGQLRAQNDSLPRAGAYPTPWWVPGQVVEDLHTLTLPPDLPPGRYRLITGLYRPEDGIRLALANGADHFEVTALRVE